MSTRTNITKIMLAGVLATLGAKAEAHYIMIGGKLVWHSLNCGTVFKEVTDPGTHPALVVCNVTAQQVELLCKNPHNRNATFHSPGVQHFTVTRQINQDDITGPGKASVNALINTDQQLLNPRFCENASEIPTAALVRSASVEIKAFECDDAHCKQQGDLASTASLNCKLPSTYNFDNMPKSGITEYQCETVSIRHVK